MNDITIVHVAWKDMKDKWIANGHELHMRNDDTAIGIVGCPNCGIPWSVFCQYEESREETCAEMQKVKTMDDVLLKILKNLPELKG